jgi:hypothetical protein
MSQNSLRTTNKKVHGQKVTIFIYYMLILKLQKLVKMGENIYNFNINLWNKLRKGLLC